MPSDPTPDAEVLPYAPSGLAAGDLGAWVLRLFGIGMLLYAISEAVAFGASIVQLASMRAMVVFE